MKFKTINELETEMSFCIVNILKLVQFYAYVCNNPQIISNDIIISDCKKGKKFLDPNQGPSVLRVRSLIETIGVGAGCT